MRRVQCEECHKVYDYDEDDFCPRCGAYNLPPKAERTRVDGLNEAGHPNSFLHEELHNEERQRRQMGLARDKATAVRQSAEKRASAAEDAAVRAPQDVGDDAWDDWKGGARKENAAPDWKTAFTTKRAPTVRPDSQPRGDSRGKSPADSPLSKLLVPAIVVLFILMQSCMFH
ncbi:MAG: hypothetical protein RRY95_05310 [Oscillospiraceae bacterium]